MGKGRVSHLRIEIANTQGFTKVRPQRVKTYILSLLVLILVEFTIAADEG
jgi:hypothetical protein